MTDPQISGKQKKYRMVMMPSDTLYFVCKRFQIPVPESWTTIGVGDALVLKLIAPAQTPLYFGLKTRPAVQREPET
jgi:hypothetical protein